MTWRAARPISWSAAGLELTIRVRRKRRTSAVELERRVREIEHLCSVLPDLQAFRNPTTVTDAATLDAVLEFLHDVIPHYHEQARETQLRRLLVRLHDAVEDADYRSRLMVEIAKSNLRSGIPDRATGLAQLDPDRPGNQCLLAELERQTAAAEAGYGSRAGLIENLPRWTSLSGDTRGRSLIAVLSGQKDTLGGKSILHIAPEVDLETWLRENRPVLGFEYRTLDITAGADIRADVTDLRLPAASVDLIICHRVLEHVLEDRRAFAEFYRVLRAPGVLQLSVPQSMHQGTIDWLIPDTSHDGHVRHYGHDLQDRLEAVGFDVSVNRLLLDRDLGRHLAEGTYPMRIYECAKHR